MPVTRSTFREKRPALTGPPSAGPPRPRPRSGPAAPRAPAPGQWPPPRPATTTPAPRPQPGPSPSRPPTATPPRAPAAGPQPAPRLTTPAPNAPRTTLRSHIDGSPIGLRRKDAERSRLLSITLLSRRVGSTPHKPPTHKRGPAATRTRDRGGSPAPPTPRPQSPSPRRGVSTGRAPAPQGCGGFVTQVAGRCPAPAPPGSVGCISPTPTTSARSATAERHAYQGMIWTVSDSSAHITPPPWCERGASLPAEPPPPPRIPSAG